MICRRLHLPRFQSWMMSWNKMLRRDRVSAKSGWPCCGSYVQVSAFGGELDHFHVLGAVTLQIEAIISLQKFGQPANSKSRTEVRAVRHYSLAENAGKLHHFQISWTPCHDVRNCELGSICPGSILFHQCFVVSRCVHRGKVVRRWCDHRSPTDKIKSHWAMSTLSNINSGLVPQAHHWKKERYRQ